jgi:hypothetical protein
VYKRQAGHIVKLYTQSPVTSSQGIADALTNLGFLTGSSIINPTASYATTASFAVSASYAPDTTFPYTGSARITGSLTVTGPTTSTQIGAGAAPSGSIPLDVRAQGALSTDSALRVRNSGNTYDILSVNGDSSVQIGSDTLSSGKLTIGASSTATLNLDTSYSTDTATISVARRITPTYNTNTLLFTQNAFSDGNVQPYRFHFVNPSNYYGYNQAGWTVIYDAGFMWHKDSATFANLQMKLTPDNVLMLYTGSVTPAGPTSVATVPNEISITGSAFQFWASGSAGNVKPYFKTQNGTVLYLGDQSLLYNVTASNVMVGSTSSLALFTSQNTTVNIGTTTIYAFPTASYDGVFIDYTARSGSNARAGQLMGIWSGSAVNYTETTTTDFGSTTAITFGMSVSASTMIVSASATTAAWTVKTIIRSI